jgi:preprotein translocase subunit SecD
LFYVDSLKEKLVDRYLDSVKTQPVYDLIIASYSYEECKKREINLGLDLRGGMNVTLEISVADILKTYQTVIQMLHLTNLLKTLKLTWALVIMTTS